MDPDPDISRAELEEAKRGFRMVLRKRMSPQFIDEHMEDLFGQAQMEFSAADAEKVFNPVGWLIHCAWQRTKNELDKQSRRPKGFPIDDVELEDDATPTPEKAALKSELQGEIHQAIQHLPAKDRELIELTYFGEMSIREAGRNLNWHKSAADRHHRDAMERLARLLARHRPQ